MSKKPASGSIGLSAESLEFVKQYVQNDDMEVLTFAPFHTITSAFIFFFSLGFESNQRFQEASTGNIAPRGFNIESFEELVLKDALTHKKSFGAIISGYAEGGIAYVKSLLDQGETFESILKSKFSIEKSS